MNESELKKLWQTTNEKLEENLALNNELKNDMTSVKVHGIIGSMKPLKIFTLIVGILWVVFGAGFLGGIFANTYQEVNKFFLYSATVQVVLTAIALGIYIFQLIKIYQVEITDPILQTQKKLAELKVSTLWAARIMFLQIPVWTTFWWNETMLNDWNALQWGVTLSVTIAATILSIWLFMNIKYENRNKRWFNLIFTGKEWSPLMKSIEMLDQIKDYEPDGGIRA
ncbi:hypothetical protein MASR1M107_02560 [Ignavibacteriales bacterium]